MYDDVMSHFNYCLHVPLSYCTCTFLFFSSLSLPPSLSLLPSTVDPLLLVDNEDIIEGGGGGRGMQYINTHRRDQHPALLVSKRSSSNDLIFQQQKGKETRMYMYMYSLL